MTRFPATRHSIVAAIRSDQADVRRSAFDTLVTAYWKPVFKYLRLKWHAPAEDAADLTQAFFLRAFEKSFFADSRKADTRQKRGGGLTIDDLGGLHPPHRLDRPMEFGSRHGY